MLGMSVVENGSTDSSGFSSGGIGGSHEAICR